MNQNLAGFQNSKQEKLNGISK